ncbi:nuclear transport factor 2-like protein [Agromyces humi]|uniref:nuclear transport factor 2 family protein n=1 Tax=Agromyces humi TaxID=1766800 RepID=UPI00135B1852|nr:nuclear transport factor 2 family protein [Agromyces humi]
MTDLPPPVAEAFAATNARDLGRFVAAFADDGVIDDWGREFRGHDEIADWSRRESIGVQQTFSVTDVRASEGAEGAEDAEADDDRTGGPRGVVVLADVGGGGFNGPSTFTFRLTPDGAAIERMTITA